MSKLTVFLLLISFQVLRVDAQNPGKDAQKFSPSANRDEQQINRLLKQAESSELIDSVQVCIDSAIAISKERSLENEEAKIYLKAGNIFENHNLYEKALANYFKALHRYESNSDSLDMAHALSAIGNIYLKTVNVDEALSFFSRASQIYQVLNDRYDLRSSRSNMGAAYQKQGDLNKALYYFRLALRDADVPGFEAEKAVLLGNTGSTFLMLGLPDSALVYLKKALAIKNKFSPEGSIIHTLNDISQVMLALNRPEESLKYAREAIHRSKAISDANQLRYAYLNASKGDSELGNFEEAYRNLLNYNNLNDSLFGLEKERQLKELRVKYESEKKDRAITTLKREKEISDFRKKVYLIMGVLVLLVAIALINWQRGRARKNRQLLKKEKEVELAKSRFFANISHEFRTPLTLIKSPIHTLLETTTDESRRKQLKTMEQSADRVLRLINQIMDLSKLEAGQLRIETQSVEIIAFLKSVTQSFHSLANSKNIQLDFKADCDKKNVNCDAGKIETILINLISNAVKNTESGGSVFVDVTFLSNPTRMEINVSDTGRGISKDKLPYIFDRYFQDESDDKAIANPGTGIGLALTKQLIELQSGTIEVQSESGVGTTFQLQIPVAECKSVGEINEKINVGTELHFTPDPKVNEQVTNDSPDEESPGKKPVLLIIEDNVDVRNYLKSILSSKYQIREAEDGLAGLEAAKQYIPDLVISDIMMPRMDGYEVCTKLKTDEKTSHIPVILLTAKTSTDSRIAGLETEADMYLSKPFIPRELLLCIKNLIESRKRLRKRYKRHVVLKPAEISVNSVDEQFLNRLMKVLEKRYSDPDFTVEQLGKEVGMSRSQIHRKLHALTNESSSRFIRAFRLQKAMSMLQKRAGTISEISYRTGFNSPSYFNKCFLEQYGYTPSKAIDEKS